MVKTFSEQFGVEPFAKMFLYFSIPTRSLIVHKLMHDFGSTRWTKHNIDFQ